MKPHLKLAETGTPDGGKLTLHAHDGRFSIRLNGQELMHSAASASERQLGESAVASLAAKTVGARVLVGGLGMGFTLSAVLDHVGPDATVELAELLPEVVEWNRTHLADLNGHRLSDRRVNVFVRDVASVLTEALPSTYHAVILDVDNGPTAMVQRSNAGLYDMRGIRLISRALKPGGRMAVWSAGADPRFAARLADAGLHVEAVPAKLHRTAQRPAYMLYLADKRR